MDEPSLDHSLLAQVIELLDRLDDLEAKLAEALRRIRELEDDRSVRCRT